jgi:methyl-accepting chemotaxis protein
MKEHTTIKRQFGILITAFAIAMPAAIFSLSYILSGNAAAVRRLAAEGNRQSDALFALIGAVGKVEGSAQRLVRERDPDELEKLVEQTQPLIKDALEKIQAAGAAESETGDAFRALTEANRKSLDLVLRGEQAQAQVMVLTESNPAFERLLNALAKLQTDQNQHEESAAAEQEARSNRTQLAIQLFAAAIVLGLVGVSITIVRRINARLRSAVRELGVASSSTAAAAAQVSRGSQALAQGASEQAASLEETSASSEQISAMTQKNAENSQVAAGRMQEAGDLVADANRRLGQMVTAMGEIQASSDKVSKIIRTIDEIAFQTNMMALKN